MLHSNSFLKECEKLKEKGFSVDFKPGQQIARGFADLGYELFCLLPNNKTTSLFTGEKADFSEDHKEFFFVVPTKDELIEGIQRKGFEIKLLSYVDQREWKIIVEKDEEKSFADKDLHFLLVKTLIFCFENE